MEQPARGPEWGFQPFRWKFGTVPASIFRLLPTKRSSNNNLFTSAADGRAQITKAKRRAGVPPATFATTPLIIHNLPKHPKYPKMQGMPGTAQVHTRLIPSPDFAFLPMLLAMVLLLPAVASAQSKAEVVPSPAAAQSPTAASSPTPTFTLDGNQLVLPVPIVFESGSEVLRPESQAALLHVKSYLDAKSYISLMRIEGHVGGDNASAQALSEKRALAIAQWLVAQGVDCKRLIAVGFGSSKPVADGATVEGRSLNTRIVLVNAALRGHEIGGMPADGGGKVAGNVCP